MTATKESLSIEFDKGRPIERDMEHELKETYGQRLALSWKDAPGVTYRLDDCEDAVPLAKGILTAIADL